MPKVKWKKPNDVTISETVLSENSAGGIVIATLGAINIKGTATPAKFSIGGEDAALFQVIGNQLVLRPGTVLDYETNPSLNITLTASNKKGFYTEAVTICVTDVNEPPTDIMVLGGKISESATSGALVGILSGRDPENDPLTYNIVGGTGVDLFTINGNTIVLAEGASLDYEYLGFYTIELEVSDDVHNIYNDTVIIDVIDELEDNEIISWVETISYIEDRADYNYLWTVNYDLAFDGNYFSVITRIDLIGDAPPPPILEQWEAGIETLWNVFALQSISGELIPVVIDVQFVEDGQQEHYDVEVVDGAGRTNMLNWYLDTAWGPSYFDEIAAHEYGHMIGNFDEYLGGATYSGYTTSGTLMSDLSHNVTTSYMFSIEYYAEYYSGNQFSTVYGLIL